MSRQDQHNPTTSNVDSPNNPPESCEPRTGGPVREKGGTTGANNLSPGGASRTGGATSGVTEGDPTHGRANELPPDP